jgi:glutathione S-transferase
MAAVNGNAPKITLYTNHGCPYAHRAHIVVKELGLSYEEVIIDLTKPRGTFVFGGQSCKLCLRVIG